MAAEEATVAAMIVGDVDSNPMIQRSGDASNR